MAAIQTNWKTATFLLCFSLAFLTTSISGYDPDDLLGNPLDALIGDGPPHHNSSSKVHTTTTPMPHVCPELQYQNMTLKEIWHLHYDTLRTYVISFLFGTLCLYWIIATITIVSMFCCCYPRGLKEADTIPEGPPVSSKPSGVGPDPSMKSQKSIKLSKKEEGGGLSKKSTKKSMKSTKKNKKTTSNE